MLQRQHYQHYLSPAFFSNNPITLFPPNIVVSNTLFPPNFAKYLSFLFLKTCFMIFPNNFNVFFKTKYQEEIFIMENILNNVALGIVLTILCVSVCTVLYLTVTEPLTVVLGALLLYVYCAHDAYKD